MPAPRSPVPEHDEEPAQGANGARGPRSPWPRLLAVRGKVFGWAVGWATIIACLTGLVQCRPSPGDGGGRTPLSPSGAGEAATISGAPSPGGAPAPGCHAGDALVDCGLAHDREVFVPVGGRSCDEDSLVLLLGGEPGIDVLNGLLRIADAGSGSACAVTTEAEPLVGTLENLWLQDADEDGYRDGGRYRPCLDLRGVEASCEEPHRTEVFYTGTATVDCRARYEEFTRHGYTADSDRVRVVSGTRDASAACWVETMTPEDELTASVRALGSTALPIGR